MLRFKWCEARNFMSVGHDGLKFDYSTGLFYCYGVNYDIGSDIDGTPISNGSGKTVCLVDAPLFALYGRTQRNINKSQIINIQNNSGCEVKLCFDKDGVEYIIERGLKPDKIVIYKNGDAEKEEAKKREANRVIVDEILDGISFEVFKNLIVLNGTSSKHFFEYGKNEKRVFINEVFRLGFLDHLQSNLTEEVKDKKAKLEVLEIQRTSKEKEVDRLRSLMEASECGEVVDITLGDLQNQLESETKKYQLLIQETTTLEQTKLTLGLDDFKTKYTNAVAIEDTKSRDLLKIEFMISEMYKNLTKLRNEWERIKTENVCIHCTQTIPEHLKSKLLEDIKHSATKINDELSGLEANKSQVSGTLFKMKSWIADAYDAITSYEKKVRDTESTKNLIERYQSQIKTKTASPLNTDKINEEIKNASNELVELDKQHSSLKDDYAVHKVCRDIVSDKNFYGYYISVFRKYLNQTINQYLEKLASPHRVQFNNDLEAEVSDGSTKVHSYENLSTGEKAKINLSLLISFFDVLYSFHRMRTSILVLDEVLDCGVDSEGVRLLHEVLKEKIVENSGLGIYVVSHKNAESNFSEQEGIKKIVFEKRHGFTNIRN